MTDRAAIQARHRTAIALLLALGALAAGPVAPAAADQANAQLAQADSAGQEYSDAKLSAFADAANEVSEIAQEWGPQIREAQEAGNNQKAQQIKQQADREIRKVIQDADGITVSEYNKIAEAAREDRDLYQRIVQMMNGNQ